MSRKTFISSDDYDIYEVPLGKHSGLGGRRRMEQKVRSSLEKLHPCFTEQCAFDFTIRCGKSGKYAVAVVIDAVLLAEYRNSSKNTFLRVRELGSRKLFIPEKTRKRNRMLICLFFVVILAGLLYFPVRDRFFAEKPKPAPVATVPVRQTREIHDVSFVLSNALDVFVTPDADVSYFEYSQQKKPQVTVRTSGLHRERIEETVGSVCNGSALSFSATTYSDRIPYLTVVIDCDSPEIRTASFADIPSSIAAIRDAVLSCDGLPVSEDCELRQYQCVIPYSGLGDFLSKLENIQENMKAGFQRFVFDYSKETGSFNCVIVLDRMKGETVIPLGKLYGFFKAPPVPEPVVVPVIAAPVREAQPEKPVPVEIIEAEETEDEITEEQVEVETAEPVQEEPKVVDPSWIPVGRMPAPDGRIVIYYRTRDGKIVYEWE